MAWEKRPADGPHLLTNIPYWYCYCWISLCEMSRHCRSENWIEKASEWGAYKTSCSGINCKLSIQLLYCHHSHRLGARMFFSLDLYWQYSRKPTRLAGWGRINWRYRVLAGPAMHHTSIVAMLTHTLLWMVEPVRGLVRGLLVVQSTSERWIAWSGYHLRDYWWRKWTARYAVNVRNTRALVVWLVLDSLHIGIL